MTIENLVEAEKALQPYVPLVAQLTGKDMTLQRIRPLMHRLGNPQDAIKIIHIAGTSGKTSTAYYLAAMLHATGSKVGLTVSPHIDSVTERAQINGQPLSEAAFCEALGEFLDIVEEMGEKPSYFELLYAFSFWVFARERVDYAVVETGMGGLHDATNIAQRADKVCVITDIGYDHMRILGDTLAKIAAQKAGIIHQGNHAFMYKQAAEIMTSIQERIEDVGAHLTLIKESQEQQFVAELARYQRRNWWLAHETFRYVVTRDALPVVDPKVLLATQKVIVPARMDIRNGGDKTLVMDGAHNAQKMAAFWESFASRFPGVKPALLLALKEGKESNGLEPLLASVATRIIVTTFNTSQDLPARSVDPEKIAASLRAAGAQNVIAIADQHRAYQALLAGPESVIVISGSFYLLSQLRAEEGLV